MQRRFHLLLPSSIPLLHHQLGPSFSSSSASSSIINPIQQITSTRSKAEKIKYATCRKYEHFAARQHGYVSRLSVAAPLVAAEWDYEKNPSRFFPSIIACSTMEPFWWKCMDCGYSYSMSPERRTVRGKGCPKCNQEDEDENEDVMEKEVKSSRKISNNKLKKNKKRPSSFVLSLTRKNKRNESTSPSTPIETFDDDDNDDTLPGERDPKLKALASGKAMMKR